MITYKELQEKGICWPRYERKKGTKAYDKGSCVKEETEKHHAMVFGRMNPITTGHEAVVNKMHEVAKEHNAGHTLVVSHSQGKTKKDLAKNPLTAEQKVGHAKKAFPGTNVKSSSKEAPTILHHAAELHKQGVTHLHVIAGSDRHHDLHELLHKYNGEHAGHGHYNFKKITVHSSGERDPDSEGTSGMSATKMREHAAAGNKKEFHAGAPSKMSQKDKDAMYKDVRHGLGIHESVSTNEPTTQIPSKKVEKKTYKELVKNMTKRNGPAKDTEGSLDKSEKVELDEKDELRGRIGTNIVNKKPREGQTDLRNIPSGNRPDSKNKFSQGERDSQPSRLKNDIKASLGKHTKPNLPEEVEVVAEMDSQQPQGRIKPDGTRSHSTYGSRDGHNIAGPDLTAKSTTPKKVIKKSTDILNRAFKSKMDEETEQKEEKPDPVHRVCVTCSEPDHKHESKREPTERFIKTSAPSKATAVLNAKRYFKKMGFKVHDAKHLNIVSESLDEHLNPAMGAGAYINDFIKSTNPRFVNKSKEERRRMAIGAYMAAKAKGIKEETETHELGVHHDEPISRHEHIKKAIETHGGKHNGHSDKATYFKFPSAEHAKAAKAHMNMYGVRPDHWVNGEHIHEGKQHVTPTVDTKKYSWGTMKTVHHGSHFSIPLHPEHHQAIAKLKDEQEHHFKDETGRHWTARRKGEHVHFQGANGGNSTVVPHHTMNEETNNNKKKFKFYKGQEHFIDPKEIHKKDSHKAVKEAVEQPSGDDSIPTQTSAPGEMDGEKTGKKSGLKKFKTSLVKISAGSVGRETEEGWEAPKIKGSK